jgi:outer membrane protein assembly factor BamD (BamD/ComL family)
VTKPPSSAEALYQQAERAMQQEDSGRALWLLHRLTRDYPRHRLTALALYDIARLALQRRDLSGARQALTVLVDRPRVDPLVAQPAHRLLCRVELRAQRPLAADRCLERFRRRYPRSTHDAEMLALLASLRYQRGGCAAARSLLEEYITRYPTGPFAQGALSRKRRCLSRKR